MIKLIELPVVNCNVHSNPRSRSYSWLSYCVKSNLFLKRFWSKFWKMKFFWGVWCQAYTNLGFGKEGAKSHYDWMFFFFSSASLFPLLSNNAPISHTKINGTKLHYCWQVKIINIACFAITSRFEFARTDNENDIWNKLVELFFFIAANNKLHVSISYT